MNSIERFSFNLLGKRMKAKREEYSQLRNDIISARMKTPFEVYLSTAVVCSVAVGLFAALVIGAFSWFLKLPALIKYKGAVPGFLVALTPYSLVIGTIFITIFSLIVFGGITYAIFLFYPSVEAGNRRRNIDATLPYAINYVTSMSTAGITPAEVFRLLGDSPIYGESHVEARYIAREIDIFGRDLIDALRLVSSSTPSKRMKEFLQGAMASISSGGNLTEYFRTKADQYALENRQTQKLFLDTLALISESYVTAMVAGTLFLIILQSIMSVLSGDNNPLFLYAVIYIMIPLGSAAFVIMISSLTPES
ncbi:MULTISPECIES: type II secretion system F family protein [unclassified Methanoregula]|uniref:type II secretion system F family protein n=1 Tax=unclassified Methanoregula TaxID=2649730 RepID=UPI0009D221BC|nr:MULTISPECIES: type II secretion system F family protein [unclassified Methanoregula]OPX64487.1 MAG: flagellar assembly protein J [Methanoregula sp. PtaB.Bin085]OPY35886.1 MAG: flagellar assembly protein J [Methanoregula sp. PtaU1.Bin006]